MSSPHVESQLELIADGLFSDGYCIGRGLYDHQILLGAQSEALGLQRTGQFKTAATGKGAGRRIAHLRGDSTLWLNDASCGLASQQILAASDAIRVGLNRRLMLGLNGLEAHYAIYPPGAGYVRHRDRFNNDDARVVSMVIYLNPAWPDSAGGQLRLYTDKGPLDILPELGTCVFFLSEKLEHEVLAATQTRMSIAGWFRRQRGVL